MGEALKFNNVSYHYSEGKGYALKNINITINEGEFVGIIGPNAAGKSTFCRASNGLIPHSFTGEITGDVYVKGINTKDKKTAQLSQYLGMVFADPEAQLSQMTVWEASRILFMIEGEIVLDGSPQEVFYHTEVFKQAGMNIPQVTEVAEYLDKKFGVWGNRPYPLTIEAAYSCIALGGKHGGFWK